MRILLGYALTFGWVFLMLGLTLMLKKAFHADDEVSRKIIHVSVAFAWIPMYLCFGSTWHLPVPTAVFIVLNYISYRRNLFSAMERTDEEKKSPGTVYYALSMTLMAVCSVLCSSCLIPYGIASFCMALGDGFAPIFGRIEKGNRRLIGARTLYGSLSVLVICFLVICVMARIFSLPLGLRETFIISVAATILELVGVRGFDNLTLPLGVFVMTYLFTR